MAIEQSTDDQEDWPELKPDFKDDWVQYTYETYGAASPEYQAAKIK